MSNIVKDEPQFWQLNKFSEVVSELVGEKIHYTTLNDWFNLLESKKIHWVTRVADNKRVYDALDVKVARYIRDKRSQSWGLAAICEVIPDEIKDLRPFPENFVEKSDAVVSIDQMRVQFGQEMQNLVGDLLKQEFDSISKLMEGHKQALVAQLQESNNPEEERIKRQAERIADNRVRSSLRIEALDQWMKLSDSERLKKTGLFRKEEDLNKRDRFIEEYIRDNFEKKFREFE